MIISNLDLVENPIDIDIPKNGEPRKIITSKLKQFSESLVLIGLVFVGRRLITKENCILLKGRRHRIFWGLKKDNKIYIKFGWNKIKNLNDKEVEDLSKNWDFNFFYNKGKYLVEKSGGVLSPDNLTYEKLNIILNKNLT